MIQALADAGLEADDIDHINAHATGTPAGDAAELNAFDIRARGDRALDSDQRHEIIDWPPPRRLRESSRRSSPSARWREQRLPPTLNLDDPEFDGWDIVAGQARTSGDSINTVLSTSFGFGGHNGAIILRRPH